MGSDVYIDIDGKAKDEAQARLIVEALDKALSSFPSASRTTFTRPDGTPYTPPPNEAVVIDTAFNGPGMHSGAFWMRYQGRTFEDASAMAAIRPVADLFAVNLTVIITCDEYSEQATYFAGPDQRKNEISVEIGHILSALDALRTKQVTGQELSDALPFTLLTLLFTPDALRQILHDVENACTKAG